MRRNLHPFAVVVAVLALAAGCGSDDGADGEPAGGSPAVGAAVPGGGLTVAEAIASTLEEPLVVKGYLFEVGGELRLCQSVLGSDPVQCGEPSLRVAGYEGDASCSGQACLGGSLLGKVADGVLTVAPTAIASG